jgi:hypothetical protein
MPKVFAHAKLKLKTAARKVPDSRIFIFPFYEYSCTRSSGPLPAAVKEIKTERVKSCTDHHNAAKILKSFWKRTLTADFFCGRIGSKD